MSTRTNYTVIVPVWGRVHVERFLEWALPSWMSPLNLPSLAVSAEVEIIILSSKHDLTRITCSSVVALLARHCMLRCIEIDDLIVGGISTVTLTLAYTRGANMAMSGGARPRLIFLNADFLLADGSIMSIARRFDAGQRLMLCASIRVREEVAIAKLERRRCADGSLTVSAREGVALTFASLHPTALACRVDQPLLHSVHPNQYFWQPDEFSLLLRSFLLFPLAVAPTSAPGSVAIYTDYGWITAFARDAAVDIIDNSDELFIMEMSPSNQEFEFVRAGSPDIAELARGMSTWTNEFSRRQAATTIVFRATDDSPAVQQAKAASDVFVRDLLAMLGPPQPMLWHPYWRGGVSSYIRNRLRDGISNIPKEMEPPTDLPDEPLALSSGLRAFAREMLLGRPGRRRSWHPFWRAEQLVAEIGPVNLVSAGMIAKELNLSSSTIGVPLAAVELQDQQTLARAVALLAATTMDGGRALLIAGHNPTEGANPITSRERIGLLLAVEPAFRIVSSRALVTAPEAMAAARHRRMAVEFHVTSPIRALKLVVRSALALVRLVLVRLAAATATAPDDSSVISLELQRAEKAGRPGADVADQTHVGSFQP